MPPEIRAFGLEITSITEEQPPPGQANRSFAQNPQTLFGLNAQSNESNDELLKQLRNTR